MRNRTWFLLIILALAALLCASCNRSPGWGMLLWAEEEYGIPSGTVLRVYIKSNIEKVWVAGIPAGYRRPGSKDNKIEIPLSKLEVAGSKRAARKRSEEFAEYALVYAETLQDGLPIRDAPDNGSRRVYRLRAGEFIKILTPVDGNPAISASGEPLPGGWFRVLTEDGTTGYCYSYRLKLFEHTAGQLNSTPARIDEPDDTELENTLSKKWVAGIYGDMIDNGNIDIEAFSKRWGFSPGEDSGVAAISLPGEELSFSYSAIRSDGGNSWRFEDTSLSMKLRSPSALVVQYSAETGADSSAGAGRKTELFVNIPTPLDDIIAQEELRRENLYNTLYLEGPAFSSASYGQLRLSAERDFLWDNFERLIPDVVPSSALGRGTVDMGLFPASNLVSQYDGALTFKFKSISGRAIPANFFYTIDRDSESGGIRLEYIPQSNIDGNRVLRRASSPMIIYFYHAD
ncbi:MAG: SH3 domain-containing protein [Spirochaetaceae bacterium]|nr:SH3 domain-containing protein [Spirochaetaceae bacterium]